MNKWIEQAMFREPDPDVLPQSWLKLNYSDFKCRLLTQKVGINWIKWWYVQQDLSVALRGLPPTVDP